MERHAIVAERSSIATAIGTAAAGLTLNDVAIIIGIIATVVTTGVSVYFRWKHYKLAEARARADGVTLDEDNDG